MLRRYTLTSAINRWSLASGLTTVGGRGNSTPFAGLLADDDGADALEEATTTLALPADFFSAGVKPTAAAVAGLSSDEESGGI
jgi:hypothetical protein